MLALFGSECADHLPTMRCAGMQLSLPLLRVPFVLPFSPPPTICTTAFCVQRSHAACQVAAPTMWRAHIAAELRSSVCCWVSCFPNAMLLFTSGAWNILQSRIQKLHCSVCCWASCSPGAMLLFTPGAWNILQSRIPIWLCCCQSCGQLPATDDDFYGNCDLAPDIEYTLAPTKHAWRLIWRSLPPN